MTRHKSDIYQRISDRILGKLQPGVRPWLKLWSVEQAAGRVARPPSQNSIPKQGVNVVMPSSAAVAHGYAAPIWMTFRQVKDLGA